MERRRDFFENFAKIKGFDPLDPAMWSLQSRSTITSFKVSFFFLFFRFCSLFLFLFFPLYLVNLLTISLLFLFLIFNQKGAHGVLAYHKGSVSQALMDLFPNIPWIKTKLFYKCMLLSIFINIIILLVINMLNAANWSDRMRRQFFEDYAKSHSFDPLVSNNWYNQPLERITFTKVHIFLIILFLFLSPSSHKLF